jgi:hypothetical protein
MGLLTVLSQLSRYEACRLAKVGMFLTVEKTKTLPFLKGKALMIYSG